MKSKSQSKLAKNVLAGSAVKRLFFFASSICLGFFQAVIFIPDSCAQSAAPQASGPIDIQANEQEFQENIVLAKGDVTVTYKDSVVTAPEAKLFRDNDGQPQKAIFVGHPHLVQNDNKISADTLVFEIANSKFIADGNAHSEVISSGSETEVDPKAPPGKKKENIKTNKPVKTQNPVNVVDKPVNSEKKTEKKTASTNQKQPFAWPKAGDDEKVARVAPAESQNTQVSNNSAQSSTSTKSTKPSANATGQEVEKIITDSDHQEYEKDSGKFDATGHVHVLHGTISVFADKLKLVYGTDGKPETALFTGNVNAFQSGNNTQAEMVTYYLATRHLQATGNVKSRMLQQKPADDGKKTAANKKVISAKPNAGGATAAPAAQNSSNSDDIIIVSDSQDMDQNTGKMSADGNVRVYYQDTVGVGPKALLLRNADGRAEKVIFTERSQISQPGKRWIADHITMAVATKKVYAEGNTKALIIQGTPGGEKSIARDNSNSALSMRAGRSANVALQHSGSGAANGTAIGSNSSEIIR